VENSGIGFERLARNIPKGKERNIYSDEGDKREGTEEVIPPFRDQ
jgi:hypothetical protein